MTMSRRTAGLRDALPYWVSLMLVPVALLAIFRGGWAILLVPLSTWWLFAGLDTVIGRDRRDLDPTTPEARLAAYTSVIRIWPPVQIALLFTGLWMVPTAAFSAPEKAGIFIGIGILTGTVGVVYAHELMHRPGRGDRWLADLLLASVLYGHFRTEHLLVHHPHVGTPRDPVTARYDEGFPRFLTRVLPGCLASAWRAEADRQHARGRPPWHRSNPFWRYAGLQAAFLLAATLVGGGAGLALFALQAATAICQLELVNYVEHYGLERRKTAGGGYEPVARHHSWNAAQGPSNRLLINLQRHADHHAKPARPFPLLQAGDGGTAPELPHGYPVMLSVALCPPLWRRIMNPRVRRWRQRHYPDVNDWPAPASSG